MHRTDFHIKKGYMIANTGIEGPLFVAPHAAIAFYKPGDNQDLNTHHIAYKLAKSMGGKAIITSVSRERNVGIDYFRKTPTQKLALENYEVFGRDISHLTSSYRREFAWVAKDKKEHKSKQRIYSNFWREIKISKQPVVFVHRQYLNPIRHPSAIDVIPFNYEEETREIVNRLNEKYRKTFKRLFPVYIDAFNFKSKCIMMKLKLEEENKKKLFRSRRPLLNKRVKRFTNKIKQEPFIEITYKRNFTGERPRKLMEKYLPEKTDPMVHCEISEFLTRRFPSIATYILEDLIKMLSKEHKKSIA